MGRRWENKWAVGRSTTHKKQTTEACVGVFFVVSNVLANVNWIVSAINGDIFDMGHLVQAESIFGIPKEPIPRGILPQGLPPSDHALGMVGVTFGYDVKRPVLQRCTIHFEPGECSILEGSVGAGKTTALRLLLGLHLPQEGDCYCQGNWYHKWPIGRVRRTIGYIPQHPVLFDRTVLENVMYGNEDHTTLNKAETLLKESGLTDRLIAGSQTRVGKGGLQLSGGQRQLVWCLRPEKFFLIDSKQKKTFQRLSTVTKSFYTDHG